MHCVESLFVQHCSVTPITVLLFEYINDDLIHSSLWWYVGSLVGASMMRVSQSFTKQHASKKTHRWWNDVILPSYANYDTTTFTKFTTQMTVHNRFTTSVPLFSIHLLSGTLPLPLEVVRHCHKINFCLLLWGVGDLGTLSLDRPHSVIDTTTITMLPRNEDEGDLAVAVLPRKTRSSRISCAEIEK